ncbi:hypothetical protein, partial [Acidisphaera sp. L21]|uniref:hypothetical protein n=1 Tax=Acidisphaera sp. L21 TaxID=1641851 RepID=UPI001C20BC14
MLPEYAREIRTKFISIQSGLLQDATLLRQSDFADAVQRAGNLVAIAREIISLPVQELLLW